MASSQVLRRVTASSLVLLSLLSLASGRLQEDLSSLNQQAQKQSPKAPFTACIDDSDCQTKGHGFACFQYICYPWADDTGIAKKDRKETCKSNDDCSGGLSCFRHHDRRQIHRGICMDEPKDCSENGRDDCKDGAARECCNGQHCCEQVYFNQLKTLPCVNHLGCKDLGYGNFCCPAKGNSTEPNMCCNEDPNPTTTTTTTRRPIVEKSTSSSPLPLLSSFLLASLLLLPFLRK